MEEQKKILDKFEKKVESKGLKYPQETSKKLVLTKAEQEVLDLITLRHCNIEQIILIRECSPQAVYKIIKKLKNKGAFDLGLNKVENIGSSIQPNQIRLHGQEFHINIIWKDHRYDKILKESNILPLDGHTIRLFKDCIEIYSGPGISFYGEDEDRAYRQAVDYWDRFFVKLEHNIKAIIKKNGVRNIREVNWHFARGDSEICENAKTAGKKIRVYCPIDGKLAYLTDESFGGKEDETVHPGTAKPDRKKIDKQVNDWRLNDPPTNSELSISIEKGFELMNGIQQNQLIFAENMKSHIKAIQDLGEGVRKNNEIIEQMKEIMKNLAQNRPYIPIPDQEKPAAGPYMKEPDKQETLFEKKRKFKQGYFSAGGFVKEYYD